MSGVPPILLDVTAVEAELERGRLYVDVRTEQEFALGHVPQAVNVPWMLGSLAGLQPNPEFAAVVHERLPNGRAIVVGCHSGGRAKSAAAVLSALGYDVIVDGLGFDGSLDAFGRRTPGWSRAGRPIERG